MNNTNNNVTAKWLNEVLTKIVSANIQDTQPQVKMDNKKVQTVDYFKVNYFKCEGNTLMKAESLNDATCIIEMQEAHPELNSEICIKRGYTLVTEFKGRKLVIELRNDRYPRSKAQERLEKLTKEAGGVYLVMDDFASFFYQIEKYFIYSEY